MKNLDPRSMKQLAALSQLREQHALADLSILAVRRRAETEHLARLAREAPAATSPEEARALEKWTEWRDMQKRHSASRIAVIAAEYAISAQICGRRIAENAVVETLSDVADAKARTLRETRRVRDQAGNLHLLTNDVCDQNILNVRPDD